MSLNIVGINKMLRDSDYKSSHLNKVTFLEERAKKKARSLTSAAKKGEVYEAYECRFCPWWHIGHAPGSQRSKRPCTLLLETTGGIISVLGYKGDWAAYRAFIGGTKIKAKGITHSYGMWYFTGALIYSTDGKKTIVGQAKPVDDIERNINRWRT